MQGYRERMREVLAQAAALLDDDPADSEAWRMITKWLSVRSELMGSAVYCAREWPQPDDACRDVDDKRPLEDRRRILWHPDEDV
jgi:hypothetical protein